MSVQHTTTPESSRLGEAHEGRTRINRRPTPPAGIEATRTREVSQSQDIYHPPIEKTFRISHLNSNKSRTALDELTLVRSRDDILLITEPPLTDGNPPELDGYILTNIQGPETRCCIYIKDKQERHTSDHRTDHLSASIRIHDRLIRCIYTHSGRLQEALIPMEEGEIRMGDFNAAHSRWKDTDPDTPEGTRLVTWMEEQGASERGPREGTHEKGRKLDLIFTKDTPSRTTNILQNGRIEHSDHKCQSITFRAPISYDNTAETKTNYRKVIPVQLKEDIKARKFKTPKDSTELMRQLEEIRTSLPKRKVRDHIRLNKDILEHRRSLNRAIRNQEDKEKIRDLRLTYRKAIRDNNNTRIEKALEESNDDHRFFELSKRGTKKKMIPPLRVEGVTYTTHEEICDAIAQHHGAADEQHEGDTNEPPDNTIPPVRYDEVTDAINKAPTDSTIGTDDIGIKLLRAYHQTYPNHLGHTFTKILREGKHPKEWKEAMVVPIPKANKETYSHPKAWRSLHLLSLVSKTLERIVLNRLQEYGERNGETLNDTQFGSRRHTGTSDAFQLYKEWKEQAHREGYITSHILADVEGGFDKVNPESFRNGTTMIDPRYNKWVYNWTQNRRIRIRHNGRAGRKVYVTNRGLPQGSPLSPYLFGAYVKEIVSEDFLQNVLIISYVDDLLICVKGKDQKEVEALTRASWARVNERANTYGMSFAENKTKTFHYDPNTTWRIGKLVKEMRFLGYWITQNTAGEDYSKHVKHWLTKANFSYNVTRAMVQRTDSNHGLTMKSTLRLIHNIVRTMAWYGLEHYGTIAERTKEVDSFLYETIKRLLDMPIATPHRSISAEYGLTPTTIQFKYVTARIRNRHATHPQIMERARRKADLPAPQEVGNSEATTAPWTTPVPEPKGPAHEALQPRKDKARHTIANLIGKINSTGALFYTDGSANPRNPQPSYGIIMLNYKGNQTATEEGRLYEGKSILDAETTAIYKAMEMALNHRPPSADPTKPSLSIIMSDSKIAIDAVLRPKRSGTLAYLNTMRKDIEEHPERHLHQFTIGHVKGHSNDPGNDLADKLAKTAKTYRDNLPLRTHSKDTTVAGIQRQKDWEEWYDQKSHQSKSRPTRRLKKHTGLTRLDSSTLFRLKTNKGWSPDDPIGTQTPPTCTLCDTETPKDAIHLLTTCEGTKEGRPPNVETSIHKQIPDPKTVRWMRQHDHFGIRNKTYEVNYIKLKIGQYRRDKDYTCPYCADKILSSKQNLQRHIENTHDSSTANPDCICDDCGKVLQRSRMERHKATHRRKNCDICGESILETGMQRHMGVHRERRCEECSKTFPTNSRLKEHMKTHEGKTCHGCSMVFKTKNRLKEHQRSNCGGSRS